MSEHKDDCEITIAEAGRLPYPPECTCGEPMTNPVIARNRERFEAATPGEWEYEVHEGDGLIYVTDNGHIRYHGCFHRQPDENASLTTHMKRQYLPLLAVLEAAEEHQKAMCSERYDFVETPRIAERLRKALAHAMKELERE